ncbi:MAG: pseudouridine synthase [Terracidiphilus sp.]
MASPKTKKSITKKSVTKKTAKSKKTAPLRPESTEPKLEAVPIAEAPKIEDPIGDETDREAETANVAGTESEANIEIEAAVEPDFTPSPRPPAKLERLQKILAAAGVASRRGAEAMIEQGRVEVNGKLVTVLGTKADAARDHIRVDGKLLQGPERHRYFVLNKPRGFVTTVKDPEGRPTVMQFFDKMKERLYPVGRLDYLSEGLLVVTNDGELANRLTKASSGVEKTYLVKVSGQPTEAELNILRGGVAIERSKPGSPPVHTSPARIRQVRQGDNPWYEVVLIEGRNRELRKMFEEIGHFVEKIRRVGYGPLVLDQEPGSLRELEPNELDALRRAAEGTLRTPKSKDLRRRNLLDAGLLPTVLPKPSGRPYTAKPTDRFAPAAGRPGNYRPEKFAKDRPGEFRPKKFSADSDRTSRADRTSRPADSFASGAANKFFRPARTSGGDRHFSDKPAWKKPERPARSAGEGFRPAAGRSFERPSARPAPSPAWKKDNRPSRPPARFAAGSTGESRPGPGRPFSAKPSWKKPERPARSTGEGFRPSSGRRFDRPSARPSYQRPATPRREAPVREARVFNEDLGPVRPPNLRIEEITGPQRPFSTSSGKPRAGGARSSAPRPYSDRPGSDRSRPSRPNFERPTTSTRPFSTSSGKPRAGGARPNSKSSHGWKPKSGAPTDRSSSVGWKSRYGPGKPASGSSRPLTPRTEGAFDYRPTKAKPYPNSASRAERKAGPGWKPKSGAPTDRSSSVGWKTRYGPGKPTSGSHSKPKPDSFAPKRSDSRSFKSRPGGKRRFSGKPDGKKRS